MNSKVKRPAPGRRLRLSKPSSECGVCLEAIPDGGMSRLRCSHQMCTACLIQHARVSNSCPFCRAKMSDSPVKTNARAEISPAVLAQIVSTEAELAALSIQDQEWEAVAALILAPILRQCLKGCALAVATRLMSWYEGA